MVVYSKGTLKNYGNSFKDDKTSWKKNKSKYIVEEKLDSVLFYLNQVNENFEVL